MIDGMSSAWNMGYGWIIVLVVLAILIILITSMMNRKRPDVQKFNSPHDILKTRYAKGEISKDEFDEKRRNIS